MTVALHDDSPVGIVFPPSRGNEVDVFSDEELSKVLDENRITQVVAEKLLTLYVGEADWWPAVLRLHERLRRKHGATEAAQMIKRAIAFTILLPAFDRTTKIDRENPENNLFWGLSYHQFQARDWYAELQKVIKRDAEITQWRREALALGIVDPIEYQPYCRQAYKWLCSSAEDAGEELTPELKNKFRKLVMAYGGAVISNIFTNHKQVLKKIVNWRTGYFFERMIFEVYSIEKVLKIKEAEISKTNPKWIKNVRMTTH